MIFTIIFYTSLALAIYSAYRICEKYNFDKFMKNNHGYALLYHKLIELSKKDQSYLNNYFSEIITGTEIQGGDRRYMCDRIVFSPVDDIPLLILTSHCLYSDPEGSPRDKRYDETPVFYRWEMEYNEIRFDPNWACLWRVSSAMRKIINPLVMTREKSSLVDELSKQK